jgi:hypothetical protein
LLLILLPASVVIGAIYGAFLHYINPDYIGPLGFARRGVRGLVIGEFLWTFPLYFHSSELARPIRQWSFSATLAFNIVASTFIIITGIFLSHMLVRPLDFKFSTWFPWEFLRDTAFALSGTTPFYLAVQVRRLIAGRVLANFILGRYHKPVQEERIFFSTLRGPQH